jgi:hypothetical protein
LSWLRAHVIHLGLFVVGLLVYGTAAHDRIGKTSQAPHFVLQADAWLHGRLALDAPGPDSRHLRCCPYGNDWVVIEEVVLDTGETVRGRRMTSPAHSGTFQLVGGGTISNKRIVASHGVTPYVSFPPLPALLMIPQVMVAGKHAHDVAFSVIFAAAVLPLLFATLRRLRAAGLSARTVTEDLWLTAMFAFGSVWFFTAVQGSVWFVAHVVGVFFTVAYAHSSIEARRPLLAGLALGLATMARTPCAFMFPLFLFEAWRVADGDRRAFLRRFAWFAAPIVPIAIAAATYNYVRFGSPVEFGHSFLDVVQQGQMEVHGLFSYHYFARNLAVAFTLLPEVGGPKWITISGHGLAMWFTTPALLLLLWPATRPPIHRALWVTIALVAIPTFFYQNSGWVQFGYRFCLDYFPFLVMLLAIGGRRFGWGTRALIIAGIVINLFGAITFDRYPAYYRFNRRATPDPYEVIVAH